jgi:hypothetical protein
MRDSKWYQRVKPHKFDQTVAQNTNIKLKELYSTPEYQQYMQKRDQNSVNWQQNDENFGDHASNSDQ